MSSHEVVSRVRRIADMKRVGHTGTLDPSACGVMIVCLGHATRLSDYIDCGTKTYRAEFLLGVSTDSCDAEGHIIDERDAGHLREADLLAVLPQFSGTFSQRPPAHSAVWINGQRAYHLARRGEEVEMPLREVTVSAFHPIHFIPGKRARFLADITCSKGTYIRSLVRDLGEALGVGATLSFLARTRIGETTLEHSVTLDELRAAAERGAFANCLTPPDAPLHYIPALTLPMSAAYYRFGTEVPVTEPPAALYRVYLENGQFLGLGRVKNGHVRPVVNLQ